VVHLTEQTSGLNSLTVVDSDQLHKVVPVQYQAFGSNYIADCKAYLLK